MILVEYNIYPTVIIIFYYYWILLLLSSLSSSYNPFNDNHYHSVIIHNYAGIYHYNAVIIQLSWLVSSADISHLLTSWADPMAPHQGDSTASPTLSVHSGGCNGSPGRELKRSRRWPGVKNLNGNWIWVNYNELTASSLEIIVSQGNHPKMALIQVSELL